MCEYGSELNGMAQKLLAEEGKAGALRDFLDGSCHGAQAAAEAASGWGRCRGITDADVANLSIFLKHGSNLEEVG